MRIVAHVFKGYAHALATAYLDKRRVELAVDGKLRSGVVFAVHRVRERTHDKPSGAEPCCGNGGAAGHFADMSDLFGIRL